MNPEQTDADAAVQEYADAFVAAKDNPTRLIAVRSSSEYTAASAACVTRMARLQSAEDALFSIASSSDMPVAAKTFMEADADRGCQGCWLSSSRGRNHSACNAKIDRYFAARDALVASIHSSTTEK